MDIDPQKISNDDEISDGNTPKEKDEISDDNMR